VKYPSRLSFGEPAVFLTPLGIDQVYNGIGLGLCMPRPVRMEEDWRGEERRGEERRV
jgi:hypothetical protein